MEVPRTPSCWKALQSWLRVVLRNITSGRIIGGSRRKIARNVLLVLAVACCKDERWVLLIQEGIDEVQESPQGTIMVLISDRNENDWHATSYSNSILYIKVLFIDDTCGLVFLQNGRGNISVPPQNQHRLASGDWYHHQESVVRTLSLRADQI